MTKVFDDCGQKKISQQYTQTQQQPSQTSVEVVFMNEFIQFIMQRIGGHRSPNNNFAYTKITFLSTPCMLDQ
jgi:hypothetical protein